MLNINPDRKTNEYNKILEFIDRIIRESMAIKLFLKIFFSLPVWLLRCLTFQKSTIINNQILDFQTQVFLRLQSLQANTFDNPNTFNSAQELREELESGRDGLPLNAKPRSPFKR